MALNLLGLTTATNFISKQIDSEYWYDIENIYFEFLPEMTSLIDHLLIDPRYGKVGSTHKIVSGSNRTGCIPGYGRHYYYPYTTKYSRYIGLERRCPKIGEREDYYIAWINTNPPFRFFNSYDCGRCYKNCSLKCTCHSFDKKYSSCCPTGDCMLGSKGVGRVLNMFCDKVFRGESGTIMSTSVDTSEFAGRLVPLKQILHQSTIAQNNLAHYILDRYTEKEYNNNICVFLHGVRGIGKSYTAFILKNLLDTKLGTCCMLINDFDPSQAGINIKSLVLAKASITSPVILCIDEIDTVYRESTKERQFMEPRLLHSRDKRTLNNMFDAITSTRYVIAIYTSELDPDTIRANPEHISYMRSGRINFISHMSKKDQVDIQKV